jgi:hypothetical protein
MSIDLVIHVLEGMEGIIKSSERKEIYEHTTKPSQPNFR